MLLDAAPPGQKLDPGHYTLAWQLSSSHCTHDGSETTIETGNVASGTLYFTVVDDKSGTDYSLSECPGYLGSFSAKSAMDTCPEVIEDKVEPQPCNSRLRDDQIKCVESYLSGETDMSICVSAFDDIQWETRLNGNMPTKRRRTIMQVAQARIQMAQLQHRAPQMRLSLMRWKIPRMILLLRLRNFDLVLFN